MPDFARFSRLLWILLGWPLLFSTFSPLRAQSGGDTLYSEITSPSAGASFLGPIDLQIQAEVYSNSTVTFWQISSPDDSFRTVKLGYDPHSINSPKQDVYQGGNTHMRLTIKHDSGSVIWNDIQFSFDDDRVGLNAYLPVGGIVQGVWTTIDVPLSAFPNDDLTNVSNIKFVSDRCPSFSISLKEVRFIGGTTEFLWFGGSKTDNSHSGTPTGQTLPTKVLHLDVETENGVQPGSVADIKFYVNGQFIGLDDTPPYEITYPGVLYGSYDLHTVLEASDSSLHSSDPITVLVQADSATAGIEIISPIDSLTFVGPLILPIKAEVHPSAEPPHFLIGNLTTQGAGNKKFKLGYDPQSVNQNPQDLSTGYDSIHLVIKDVDSTINWNDLGIKLSTKYLDIDPYLPTGGLMKDQWTEISIPLADFAGADLSSVAHIMLPFGSGSMLYRMGIQSVRFTGSSPELLWFGGSKVDNSYDGAHFGETPENDELNAELIGAGVLTGVDVYVDGLLVGTDSISPYTATSGVLDTGWVEVVGVARYSDGSQQLSETISIYLSAEAETEEEFELFGSELFSTQLERRSVQMVQDPLTGNYVITWQEIKAQGDADVMFAIMDTNFQLIALPPGDTAWPIEVSVDPLLQASSWYRHGVSIAQDTATGNFAISWKQTEPISGDPLIYYRVFDRTGAALAPYQSAEQLLNATSSAEYVSNYSLPYDIEFGPSNQLYVLFYGYENLSNPPWSTYSYINAVDVTTGGGLFASDYKINHPALTYHAPLQYTRQSNLAWDPVHNHFYYAYDSLPSTKVIRFDAGLTSDTVITWLYPLDTTLNHTHQPFLSFADDKLMIAWLSSYKANGAFTRYQFNLGLFQPTQDSLRVLGSYHQRIQEKDSLRAIYTNCLYMPEKDLVSVGYRMNLYDRRLHTHTLNVYEDTISEEVIFRPRLNWRSNKGVYYFNEEWMLNSIREASMVSNQFGPEILFGSYIRRYPTFPDLDDSDIIIWQENPFSLFSKNYAVLAWDRPASLYRAPNKRFHLMYESKKVSEDILFEFYDDDTQTWNAMPSISQNTQFGPNKFALDISALDDGQTYMVRAIDVEGDHNYFRIWKP